MTQAQKIDHVEKVLLPVQEGEHTEEPKELSRYEAVYHSERFQNLVKQKRNFIVPLSIFYVAYGMLLPFLVFYTDLLEVKVIGDITLAWIYGMSVVVVSLIISQMYIKRAERFDEEAKSIVEREGL